jgi:hypothetical protein
MDKKIDWNKKLETWQNDKQMHDDADKRFLKFCKIALNKKRLNKIMTLILNKSSI